MIRHVKSDEVVEVLEQTHSHDPKTRAAALRELCPCHLRRNLPEVWERVFEMVGDPEPRVRSTIVHLLADGSPKELEERVVATIEGMTNDPDRKIRRQTRRLIAHYRRTGQINIL
jgi:hypothetical protein